MDTQRAPSPALSTASSQTEPAHSLPSIRLERGLENQDDNIDDLMTMYEDLQLSSAEAAGEDNFMLFVEKTCYFSVIQKPRSSNLQTDMDTISPPTNQSWRLWSIPQPQPQIHDTVVHDPALGFIYLTRTQDGAKAQSSGGGELNIGVIIKAAYRGQGYARAAVTEVLRHAFMERVDCHRVQALLPGVLDKDRAIHLFTELGFGHEGTRRRAFFSFGEWKDITCLGILNTDWAFLSKNSGPMSLWDEMFRRHDRERDQLLAWEERSMVNSLLKRTSSMETICARPTASDSTGASTPSESVYASDASTGSSTRKGKRPALFPKSQSEEDNIHEMSTASRRFDHGQIRGSPQPFDTEDNGDYSEAGVSFARELDQALRTDPRSQRSVSPASSTFSFPPSGSQSPYPPSDTASESESSTSGWSMMDQDDYDVLSSMDSDVDVVDQEEARP